MEQIERMAILVSALSLILPYGELALHKFLLYALAKKENDTETAESVLTEALMAAGIAGAGLWLLLVVFTNGSGGWLQAVYVGLLFIGSMNAVALYVRVRFRRRIAAAEEAKEDKV